WNAVTGAERLRQRGSSDGSRLARGVHAGEAEAADRIGCPETAVSIRVSDRDRRRGEGVVRGVQDIRLSLPAGRTKDRQRLCRLAGSVCRREQTLGLERRAAAGGRRAGNEV